MSDQTISTPETRERELAALKHQVRDMANERNKAEQDVRTLQARVTALEEALRNDDVWKGCTFKVGEFNTETDTYPIYQHCGNTNCGSLAEFYGEKTAHWFVNLLNRALTPPAAAQEETP